MPRIPRPRRETLLLAVGVVSLEFAAAVSRFVSVTMLPVITVDLAAQEQLAFLIAGTSLGLFVALPLAGRVLRTLGNRRTAAIGMAGYLGGLAAAAMATNAWVFVLGQFVNGVAGGLLAIFGISAAIEHLDDSVRAKIVGISASMWILPALIGPVATLGLEHIIRWRWTLLVPAPVVVIGRMLVIRAIGRAVPLSTTQRPLGRTLLIPLGAAIVILAGQWWPATMAGVIIMTIGVAAVMPEGTLRCRRGPPAALLVLMFFGTGYFGADSLVTVFLTDGYGASLGRSALVLSAAPLAWGVTSLVITQVAGAGTNRRLPVIGLALAAVATTMLTLGAVAGASFTVPVIAWAVAGVGVGIAYPALYVAASTPVGNARGPEELAVAVITAETVGALIGQSLGGTFSSAAGPTGLLVAFAMFAGCLAAASCAATRTRSAL